MNIIERIKYIRSHFGLNQSEFGARIGLSRDAVANIELGRAGVKDLTISMICREFNVSEIWLKGGEGEAFLKKDDEDLIMEAVGRIMSEDSSRRRVIAFLSKLPPEKWEMLEALAHEMYEAIKKD